MEDKKDAIVSSILTQLKCLNSEFANYVPPEDPTHQINRRSRIFSPRSKTSLYPPGRRRVRKLRARTNTVNNKQPTICIFTEVLQ
jgi:hypothetical protein